MILQVNLIKKEKSVHGSSQKKTRQEVKNRCMSLHIGWTRMGLD